MPEKKLICQIPPIERKGLALRVLRRLETLGYSTSEDGIYVLDWVAIKRDLAKSASYFDSVRGLGVKSISLLREWLAIVERDYSDRFVVDDDDDDDDVPDPTILSMSITVVFYDEDEDDEKKSIFICQMLDVPRVGDYVNVKGFYGEVVSVVWDIDEKGIDHHYAGVVLKKE